MNLRKGLISLLRRTGDNNLKSRIKNLNYEIKEHYTAKRRSKVRKGIIPGSSKTLWRAVSNEKKPKH